MTVEQLAKVDAREVMSEDEALHKLMHCEDEGACRFCNPLNGYADVEQAEYYAAAVPPGEPLQKPTDLQVDGPRSCENYWNCCNCEDCKARDRWYEQTAT